MESRKPRKALKPRYTPLEARTQTIADIRDYDTTETRESVMSIISHVQEKQRRINFAIEAIESLDE
jgi:hypothetical protein